MKPSIRFENVTKKFRKTEAVAELDLEVPEGKITAFLGPNGAGKTTSIKLLLGLLRPTKGSIEVLGRRSTKLAPEGFRDIGYVSENQELPLWMTVRQMIDFCAPLYPTWDRDLERKLLDQFELAPEAKLRSLSRGQQMKAALLTSLAFRPKLLVLDEPFSGLDVLMRDEFIRGLLEITEREGWTVFVSSHDIDEVERLADRVALINRGRLRLNERAEDLQKRFRSVEVTIDGNGDHQQKLMPGSWLNPSRAGNILRFTHSEYVEGKTEEALLDHLPEARHPEFRPMPLRDIFLELAKTYRLAAGTNGAAS